MPDKPLFSVIVPVYGVADYLEQCIQSVLKQTYSDFELILVDDGGTDRCPVICDEYAERDFRVSVIHKTNGGLVSARKAGLEKATGKYIIPLDGDDFLPDSALQQFAAAISSSGVPVVLGASTWWYEQDRQLVVKVPLPSGRYTKAEIEQCIFPCLIENTKSSYFPNNIWASAYRTDLYKKFQMPVPDQIKIGEDAAFKKPLLAEVDSLTILDESVYVYRQNTASMTKNRKPFSWESPELIARHLETMIPMDIGDFQKQVYRNCVHNLFNVAVTRFFQDKKRRDVYAEIYSECSRPYSHIALQNADFAFGSKGWFAAVSLKHKCFFLVYLFSKIK